MPQICNPRRVTFEIASITLGKVQLVLAVRNPRLSRLHVQISVRYGFVAVSDLPVVAHGNSDQSIDQAKAHQAKTRHADRLRRSPGPSYSRHFRAFSGREAVRPPRTPAQPSSIPITVDPSNDLPRRDGPGVWDSR